LQNAFGDLMTWVEKTKIRLNDDTKPHDVNTAEDLLKKHYDLKDDIAAKDDEFAYVNALGLRLLDKNKGAADVKVNAIEMAPMGIRCFSQFARSHTDSERQEKGALMSYD
jgi:hypothetical protein